MKKILILILGLLAFNLNGQELLKEGGVKTSGATSGQTVKWNGTTWAPADDKNGYYGGNTGNGGDGTVPNGTTSTLTDDFTIHGVDNTGTQAPKFRITATGTDPGVQLWKVGNDSVQLSFISGEPTLEAIGTSGNDFWISAVGNDLRLGNNSTGVFTHTTKNVLGGYLAVPFVETAASITVTEAQSEVLVTGTSGVITLTFDNTSNLLGSAAKTIKVRNQGSHNVTLSRGSQSWQWIDMVGSATASNQTLAAGETATMLWYDGGVTDYYLLQKMPATFTGGSTNLAVTGTSSPLTLTSDTGTDVTLTAGTNITLSGSSGNITINATGGSGDILNGGNTTGAAIIIGTNDANALNFETGGGIKETIATTGAVTNEVIAATNNAINTAFTTNVYNGSVVAGFGMKHVYRLNTDLGSLPFAKEDQVYWTLVDEGGTGYTSESKIRLQNFSTLTDHTKFTWTGSDPVISFGTGTTTFGNSNIIAGNAFTLTAVTNPLYIGTSSGLLNLYSTGTGASIVLDPDNANGWVDIGTASPSTITSGAKYNMRFPQGFSASSGTGTFDNVLLSGTINQSGTASGIVSGIHVGHTITNGINYRGLLIDANGGTNSKGVYQTGSSMTNNFVGNTFFGATTSPTAMLHLGAGTTTLAPFKLTSGTNLTTPEAGAIEWNGTNLFVTQTSGPTRKTLAYTTDITDASATNEGSLTVNAGSGSTSVISSNTSGSTDVTITAGTGIGISESGNNITLTNTGIITEVDGSTTNELQTVANTSDATSHTVTLSNSGGSVQLVEGSGITLTTTGTSGAGVVTIASSAGGSGDITNGGNSTGSAVTIGTNDNNALNLETNNVTRFSIASGASTGGTITATNITANTSTTVDALTLSTNSTGSVAAGFGTNILFKGEVGGVENTDMGRLKMVYDGTGGSEQVGFAIELNSLGTVAQAAKFDRYGTMSSGRTTPTQYGGPGVGIIPASDLLINTTTANNTYVGGGTGRVRIRSGGSGTYGIEMGVTDATNGTVVIGVDDGSTLTSTSTTTADRPILELKHGFAAASGGNRPIGLLISNALDQTGSAFGVMTGIKINPSLTNVANTYRAIDIVQNHSSSKGIYQSGTSTTNNFVGKTYFGSTSAPTALVQVGAGTTTVAPIILTSGTNLTTPAAGALEWNGTNLFATQTTGPTRKTIAYTSDIGAETVISPASFSTDQNNYNPTDLATATTLRLTTSVNLLMITGITAPSVAKTLTLINIGSNTILLTAQDASSSAANRFQFFRDIPLYPGCTVVLTYDLTSAVWRSAQGNAEVAQLSQREFNTQYSVFGAATPVGVTVSTTDATITAPTETNGALSNLAPGGGTASNAYFYTSSNSLFPFFISSTVKTSLYFEGTIVTPANLSDATNNYSVACGFASTVGTSEPLGANLFYNHSVATTWQGYTKGAGNSVINTGITFSASTKYKLGVQVRPDFTVAYFINDAYVGETSTNIPTSRTMVAGIQIYKNAGTSRTLQFVEMEAFQIR